MQKILHHSFIPTTYENLIKSLLFTYLLQTKIWKLVYLIWVIERIKAVLRYFPRIMLNKWKLSQKCKISCSLITTTCSHTIFIWLSSTMKQLLEKFNFELLHAFNFSFTWNKEASSCRKNILSFRHNIPYMVN